MVSRTMTGDPLRADLDESLLPSADSCICWIDAFEDVGRFEIEGFGRVEII